MELKHVNKLALSTERIESRHQTDSPDTGWTPSREERNVRMGQWYQNSGGQQRGKRGQD